MILASVIVAVYKDIEALSLIIHALCNQSVKEFEIIIAEDGADPRMSEYVSTIPHPYIVHTTQSDEGWRKNSSLNNAIRHSNAELLLFLDGDCIPNHRFVESYLQLQAPKTVLCGRRIELGPNTSMLLRNSTLMIEALERGYIWRYWNLLQDGVRHYEEGIFSMLLYRLRHEGKDSTLIGCNMGINKTDIISINGFNEEYCTPTIGEDTDVEWRLRQIGCTFRRVRNRAFVFHLDHKRTYDDSTANPSSELFARVVANNEVICFKGLVG